MRTRRLRNAALAAVAVVGIGAAGVGAVLYRHRPAQNLAGDGLALAIENTPANNARGMFFSLLRTSSEK